MSDRLLCTCGHDSGAHDLQRGDWCTARGCDCPGFGFDVIRPR